MNIIIAGGSRGIGKAIAGVLAVNGNKVLITGRNIESLINAQKEIGSNISIFDADINDVKRVDELANFVGNTFVPDVLILSAAQFPKPETARSVVDADAEELSGIINTNVVSNYRLVKKLLPYLKKSQNPRIIVIGSTAGVRTDNGGVYGISKAALINYVYNLRAELKKENIGVSLINPGATFTETRKKKSPEDDSLLESKDFGILVNALLNMSHQAVLERVDIRPLAGETA